MKLVSPLLAFVLLGSACRTDHSMRAGTVLTVADTLSTAAVFDAIVERSKHLDSFDATYRFQDGTSDVSRFHLRFAREQGLAISVGDERMGFVTAYRDGALAMRITTAGGEPAYAHVDCTEVIRRTADVVAESVSAELPELAFETRPIRPFVRFDFKKREGPHGDLDLQIGIGYGPSIPAQGWIAWLGTKLDACERRGPDLLFAIGDGVEVDLSAANGFLTSIRTTAGADARELFALEALRTPATFDAHAFDLPPRPDGARDVSAETAALFADGLVRDLDQRLCARFERLVADGTLAGDAASVEKLARVLATSHRDTIDARFGPWHDETEAAIEKLGAWITSSLASTGDAEAKVDRAVATWREKLVARLDAFTNGIDARFGLPYKARANPELHAELQRIVRDSERTAFVEQFRDPLLAELDARVARARN